MKRIFSLAIVLMAAFASVQAQNVQLHYDLVAPSMMIWTVVHLSPLR